MSGRKCRNCGSTDIETDPARGDAVCTECGVVLEDQLIVNETLFEEAPSGNMMVLGQFVGNDSTGGATGFGAGKFFFYFLPLACSLRPANANETFKILF